jgi:hypothetical protein
MYFVSIVDPFDADADPDSIVVGDPDFDKGNYTNGNSLGFSDTNEVLSASMEIAQVTPNNSLVDIKITAYDIDPDGPVDNGVGGNLENNAFLEDPIANDDAVNILSMKVFNGDGDLIEFWEWDGDSYELADDPEDPGTEVEDDPSVNVSFDEISPGVHSATVFNVADNYDLLWTVEVPADVFKAENVDSTDSAENDGFDIGGFNFLETQPTEDMDQDWTVKITDFDGDWDQATFETGIDGTLGADDGLVTGVDDTSVAA